MHQCGACIAAWANLLALWWTCRHTAHSVQLSRRTAAAAVISDTDGMDTAAVAEHGLKIPLLSLLQQDGQDGAHGGSMLQGGGGGRARPRQHVAAKRLSWGGHALVGLPAAAQRAR